MAFKVIFFAAAIFLNHSIFSTAFPSSNSITSSDKELAALEVNPNDPATKSVTAVPLLTPEVVTIKELGEPDEVKIDFMKKLKSFLIESYVELAYSSAKEAKDIFLKVLQDNEVSSKKTPDMNRYTKQMSAFTGIMEELERAEKPDHHCYRNETNYDFDMEFMVLLFVRLEIFVDTLCTVEQDKLNEEDLILKTALERHGIIAWKQNLLKNFAKLSQTIVQDVQDIIDDLTEEEKQSEAEFLEFFKSFKATEDIKKRYKMFYDYFHLSKIEFKAF